MSNNVTITEGTQSGIATDQVGTVHYQGIKLDMGTAGVSNPFKGTIPEVSVLAKGTIGAGTVDAVSQLPPNSWGTTFNTSGSTLGTIKAAVSGSVIYVDWLVISVGSASNVVVGNGAAANPIGGTWYFNANGGLSAGPLNPPIQTSSGSALVIQQSTGTSPMSVTVGGWVR